MTQDAFDNSDLISPVCNSQIYVTSEILHREKTRPAIGKDFLHQQNCEDYVVIPKDIISLIIKTCGVCSC